MEGAHLAAVGGDDPQVSRDPVAAFHLHEISDHHVLSVDVLLLAVADNQRLLKGDERGRIKDAECLLSCLPPLPNSPL